MDILRKIAENRTHEESLHWEGSFAEYLEIVKENPHVAGTAHDRVYRMVKNAGITPREDGSKEYTFFSQELFGLDEAIERLVEEYLHSAAKRLDVRKRILLL